MNFFQVFLHSQRESIKSFIAHSFLKKICQVTNAIEWEESRLRSFAATEKFENKKLQFTSSA